MNRSTVVALVAAAVVGVLGGTASAVLREGSGQAAAHSPGAGATTSPGSSPSGGATSPSPTPPSPSPTESNEPLLYAGGGLLRDGEGTTRYARPGRVTQVARVADGFLVSTATSAQDATQDLWFVDVHGDTRRIAQVTRWDIDAEAVRVTAYDLRAAQVRVWELPSGKVVGRYATEGDPRLTPSFAGHDVYVAQDLGDRIQQVRWDPDTGRSSVVGTGYDDQSLSPGGSYLAGAVGPDGTSAGVSGGTNGCLHVESTYLKKFSVSWRTCDWEPLGDVVRFSPDGTRLLATRSGADQAAPAEIGVFDASDGPRALVGSFRTPEGTTGAQWADNDHLYLYGSTTGDPSTGGTWIRRCDLDGGCQEVARTTGPVMVGSGT